MLRSNLFDTTTTVGDTGGPQPSTSVETRGLSFRTHLSGLVVQRMLNTTLHFAGGTATTNVGAQLYSAIPENMTYHLGFRRLLTRREARAIAMEILLNAEERRLLGTQIESALTGTDD
jgi:hypothetical protein